MLPDLVCSAAANSSALASECHEKLATASPEREARENRFLLVPMAPKRSAGRGKVGKAAGDEAKVHRWKSSKCSDSHLLGLIAERLLQPRNVIHWRRSAGESFPHKERNESVVFLRHVLRGLGFSISDFFRGLLHCWGVQVHHLTPNSILHISIFVHLCEAFLGIKPHFDLFQYFFHLKPHPNDSKVDVVGGAGLQFR